MLHHSYCAHQFSFQFAFFPQKVIGALHFLTDIGILAAYLILILFIQVFILSTNGLHTLMLLFPAIAGVAENLSLLLVCLTLRGFGLQLDFGLREEILGGLKLLNLAIHFLL